MERLVDPDGDYLKTEKNVTEYLHSIPDENLRILYENIEWTPFPLLLAKEYQRRKISSSKNTRNEKTLLKNQIKRQKEKQKTMVKKLHEQIEAIQGTILPATSLEKKSKKLIKQKLYKRNNSLDKLLVTSRQLEETSKLVTKLEEDYLSFRS